MTSILMTKKDEVKGKNNGEALCKKPSLTSMLPLEETHTTLEQTVTHITKK